MEMDKKNLLPKTKAEFEAYARAVDAANEQVIASAIARNKKAKAEKKASPAKGKSKK